MGLAGRWLAMMGALGQARGAAAAPPGGRSRGWSRWRWSDPQTAVLALLVMVVVLGGARRWIKASRARRAADRLLAPDVTLEEIEAAPEHGREGLMPLFRLLEAATGPAHRTAAGRALARLWAQDELIIEEEKAVVTRGFEANWKGRRRYPRAITRGIPIEVAFGVPFLDEAGPGVKASNLEWSYRVTGAERVDLESFTAWAPGVGHARFEIEPRDFAGPGPHRLVLQARARTRGLTDTWELALPHVAFSIEFDPRLEVSAVLTEPDSGRAEAFERAVRLEPRANAEGGDRVYLNLNDHYALRDAPELVIGAPLPCDLAHQVAVEIEGVSGRFSAGTVIVSGDGPAQSERFALGPIVGVPSGAFDGAGEHRLRAILTADAELGWAAPATRSLWPGTITTAWCAVRVVRR